MTIRMPQLHALSEVARAAFIEHRIAALRSDLPDQVAESSDAELRVQIDGCITRTARYGIQSKLDVSRYINIAATLGWKLEDEPEHAWMKSYLCDPSVTSPSQRIDRLLAEIIRRAAADHQSRVLRHAFA